MSGYEDRLYDYMKYYWFWRYESKEGIAKKIEFLKSSKQTFSPFEEAALICQSVLPREKKISLWKSLIDNEPDGPTISYYEHPKQMSWKKVVREQIIYEQAVEKLFYGGGEVDFSFMFTLGKYSEMRNGRKPAPSKLLRFFDRGEFCVPEYQKGFNNALESINHKLENDGDLYLDE